MPTISFPPMEPYSCSGYISDLPALLFLFSSLGAVLLMNHGMNNYILRSDVAKIELLESAVLLRE